jgi:hypothetical protein
LLEIGLLNDDTFEKATRALIVIAVNALMSGYTRMTYCLAIIILETSQAIDLFIPSTFAILISIYTGSFISRSLYTRAVRGKQMPILIDEVPQSERLVVAELLMSRDIVSVGAVDRVSNLMKALSTTHHAFPVFNQLGNVVGVIPKNFIIVLLTQNAFYKKLDGPTSNNI